MNNNWTEARMQMDQVLEAEWALVKARRLNQAQRSLLGSLFGRCPQWLGFSQAHSQPQPASKLAAE